MLWVGMQAVGIGRKTYAGRQLHPALYDAYLIDALAMCNSTLLAVAPCTISAHRVRGDSVSDAYIEQLHVWDMQEHAVLFRTNRLLKHRTCAGQSAPACPVL